MIKAKRTKQFCVKLISNLIERTFANPYTDKMKNSSKQDGAIRIKIGASKWILQVHIVQEDLYFFGAHNTAFRWNLHLSILYMLVNIYAIHSFDSIEHQFVLFGFFPLTLLSNVVPSFPTHTSFVSFVYNREKTNNFESKKKNS